MPFEHPYRNDDAEPFPNFLQDIVADPHTSNEVISCTGGVRKYIV